MLVVGEAGFAGAEEYRASRAVADGGIDAHGVDVLRRAARHLPGGEAYNGRQGHRAGKDGRGAMAPAAGVDRLLDEAIR